MRSRSPTSFTNYRAATLLYRVGPPHRRERRVWRARSAKPTSPTLNSNSDEGSGTLSKLTLTRSLRKETVQMPFGVVGRSTMSNVPLTEPGKKKPVSRMSKNASAVGVKPLMSSTSNVPARNALPKTRS